VSFRLPLLPFILFDELFKPLFKTMFGEVGRLDADDEILLSL
jgi:hypothetical protein